MQCVTLKRRNPVSSLRAYTCVSQVRSLEAVNFRKPVVKVVKKLYHFLVHYKEAISNFASKKIDRVSRVYVLASLTS